MRRLILGLAVVTMMASGAADATDFHFDYSFYNSDYANHQTSASGTISATAVGDGSYLVNNVTGTWNGIGITGVAPLDVDGHGNDNLIFPDNAIKLDENGLSFLVADHRSGDSGDGTVTVYYYVDGSSPAANGYTDFAPGTSLNNPTFNLTPLTSTAPEPGSWALMLLGMGSVGLALRRRRPAFAAAS